MRVHFYFTPEKTLASSDITHGLILLLISFRPVIQIKISRFTFLEKRKSWDIFLLIQTKNLEKKNLEIFGGHLAKIFCEVNLKIFVSWDLLFFLSFRKSRDFLY